MAAPEEAATVVAPDSVPLPGLLWIAIVIVSEAEVTVLPYVSCMRTVGCTAKFAPAVVDAEGCVLKNSFVLAAGVIVIVPLRTVAFEPEEAFSLIFSVFE